MSPPSAQHPLTTHDNAHQSAPEASPFWSIVLVLAEIAARVERRQSEEHADTLPRA